MCKVENEHLFLNVILGYFNYSNITLVITTFNYKFVRTERSLRETLQNYTQQQQREQNNFGHNV